MHDILIHSPFPRETTQGNTITADRLEKILLENGISITMSVVRYSGQRSRCLVALNAWRSSQDVVDYRLNNPEGKVIIIITGSDINHKEMTDADSATRKTMADADTLVMLHHQEFGKLTKELQEKCHVIYPSVELPEEFKKHPKKKPSKKTSSVDHFSALIAGNLRPVKNPLLAIEACKKMPATSRVIVSSYGSAETEIAQKISQASAQLANYQWHGMVSHKELLPKMKQADILLNVSLAEGGANAICEAIMVGLPIIASDIGGNKGMLGQDYLGYFPSGDSEELATLLEKVANQPTFYQSLKAQIEKRAEIFSYKMECSLWLDLVKRTLS